MSQPNYESIGRCVVLQKEIREHIEALITLKDVIAASIPPELTDASLTVNGSTVYAVENAGNEYRQITNDIIKLAKRFNEIASSAGYDEIKIRLFSFKADPIGGNAK